MNHNRIFQILLITVMTIALANTSQAQTHLILGSEEEENDAMLLRPRQIEEGPDGNLYVLDGGDSCIKVYSPTGDYLRKLAGPGEGPGEFQRTDGATFGFTTDGNLFFTEYFGGHRWLTLMELNGDLIRTLAPQLQVNYGIDRATSLDNGGFLVQITFDSEAFPSHNYYLYNMRQSLVQMDNQGAIVAEIVETEHPSVISFTPNGGTSNLPFAPVFVWIAHQDSTITWSDGLNPRLSVLDFTGQTVREIDTKLPPPEKVTDDELKSWCRSRKEAVESSNPTWWHRFGRVIEDYDKSLFDKPILQRISAAPADHILVEGYGNPETEQKTFWLFDQKGTMIATITAGVWSLHISTNHLLYFSDNEDGSTAVNVVKWEGNVGESLSLVKIDAAADDE